MYSALLKELVAAKMGKNCELFEREIDFATSSNLRRDSGRDPNRDSSGVADPDGDALCIAPCETFQGLRTVKETPSAPFT